MGALVIAPLFDMILKGERSGIEHYLIMPLKWGGKKEWIVLGNYTLMKFVMGIGIIIFHFKQQNHILKKSTTKEYELYDTA